MNQSKSGLLEEVGRQRELEEELRRAKEEAEQASALKDRFVSMVAHDLRSPLGSIAGLLELVLEEDKELGEESRELIVAAYLSVGNMLQMVEELLNLSRLKAGKITFDRQFLDGHYLVGQVIDRIRQQAEQKGVAIHNRIPEGTRLYTDHHLFSEVIQNLLVNALKFSHSGGEIEILRPEGEDPVIAVRDHGVGIPAELHDQLFQMDLKTSTPGTAGEKGTGLGLPFCFDVMAAAGGRLWLESEPGAGSTFYAGLPAVRPRVLVVDDQRVDRQMASLFLRQLAVEVVECEGAEQALEALQRETFHLLISDITMPGMDGFTLLRAVRKDPSLQSLSVILVTGDQEMKTRDTAFRLGADDYAVKPIVAQDFLPRVRRMVG